MCEHHLHALEVLQNMCSKYGWGVVKSLEFWPVNVMFGRRFPFFPSNWRRGILVFKGEVGKKSQ